MDRLLLSIPEAAAVLGVGRTKLYELVDRGVIATVTIGRRRLVPAQALEDYARRLVESQRGAA